MKSQFFPTKPKGLGDIVHHYAQPIAEAIDRATAKTKRPTNLGNCGGCKKRQQKLNGILPTRNS